MSGEIVPFDRTICKTICLDLHLVTKDTKTLFIDRELPKNLQIETKKRLDLFIDPEVI